NSSPGVGWTDRGANTTGFTETNNLTQTTTYVRRTTTGSCVYWSNIITINITEVPALAMSSNVDPTICTGTSINLTASGATSYVWSPGTSLSSTTTAATTASPTANITYNVVGTANGCSAATAPTNGLLAWYPLDEDADDVIGGVNGTVTSATLANAQILKGYNFTAGTNKITVPHNAALSSAIFGTSNNFTISAWVYPTAWTNYSSIVTKANGGSWSNTTAGIWSVANGLVAVMGANVGGNPAGSYISVTYKPTLNEWHHVIAIADGTNLNLYVDGILRGQSAISGITATRSENTAPITIGGGRVNNQTAEYFPGIIDDVKMYNRGLSEAEMRNLYRSPSVRVRVTPTANAGTVTAGTTPQCIGATTTYTVSGVVLGGGSGAWSSSNGSVATVN
ncbi:MAG TPA: LamG domain-containing protein, partial [Chitinophagales bacterium]|nr:LamG domain-containing protein [Chitinophagales bacterium]